MPLQLDRPAWEKRLRAYTAPFARYGDLYGARASLEGLAGRDLLVKRLTTLEGGASPDYFDVQIVKGTIFAMKSQPPKQQPFVVALKSADDPAGARVVVDPNRLDPGGTTAIDWYVASPDARLVQV